MLAKRRVVFGELNVVTVQAGQAIRAKIMGALMVRGAHMTTFFAPGHGRNNNWINANDHPVLRREEARPNDQIS
jgi:hypothetical protein